MTQTVVLVTEDGGLAETFRAALPESDRLIVVRSPAEVPSGADAPIDTVVLDVPSGSRRAAYEQVRIRHAGRLLIPVADDDDLADWPDDPARRFLRRPIDEATALAGVLAPIRLPFTRQPVTARRRRLLTPVRAVAPPGRRPNGLPAWIEPSATVGEAPAAGERADAPASPGAKRVHQPGPEWADAQSFLERAGTPPPAGAPPAETRPPADASPAETPPGRSRTWRGVGMVLAGLVLLLVGGLVGATIVPSGGTERPSTTGQPAATAAPGTTLAPPTAGGGRVAARGAPPAACSAALDHADAAISYLVANIRDARLSQALKQYEANRRACRGVSR